MNSLFLTFIKPYLEFIDSGNMFRKPFSWLYSIFAAISLLFPLYVFVTAVVESDVLDAGVKFVFAFLLLWLVIAFAGWVSFQLWWDRRLKVLDTSIAGDEFVATPVFSHLVQTLGESIGTWLAIVGFGVTLIATVILGSDARYLDLGVGFNFLEFGWLAMILMPLLGFMIIVVTRFLAEQYRALASIANNTRKF